VILTKVDKLSRMKIKEHIRAIAADLYLGESNLIATSSETGYGKIDVLKKIRNVIDAANEAPYQEDDEEYETDELNGVDASKKE
jgi:selenocysteine-specific translation elongation factor